MRVGSARHLGKVRDAEHLPVIRNRSQAAADHFRHRTADPRIRLPTPISGLTSLAKVLHPTRFFEEVSPVRLDWF
jgi:hypothetical protein